MNYTKTVWKDWPDTSTPITADKLNNLENGVEYLFENGVGGGSGSINVNNEQSTSTTDTYSCNYVNNAIKEVYSTEEAVVGAWMGKPIYRKVITGNTGVLTNVPKYNISDDMDICTHLEGFINDGSNNLIPINYANSGALVWAYITAERKLGIQSNVTYFDNCPLYVTLEYTKTTDSGINN